MPKSLCGGCWVVVVCKPILVFSLSLGQAEQYLLVLVNIVFDFRIVGRLSDPLVGAHGQLVDGSDRVVPGSAGLSLMQYNCVQKYMIYFITFTSVISSDTWTRLLYYRQQIFLAHEISKQKGLFGQKYW